MESNNIGNQLHCLIFYKVIILSAKKKKLPKKKTKNKIVYTHTQRNKKNLLVVYDLQV